MVGVETPSSLAVRFIDKPLTYSSTAAAFRASGLPRAGVSVKLRPQALHKERCLPRISPFLTYLALPQRLQHSSMTTLLKDPLPQEGRASLLTSNPRHKRVRPSEPAPQKAATPAPSRLVLQIYTNV